MRAWNQRLHVGLVQEPLVEGSNDNVLYFTHSTLRRYVWPIIVLLIKEPLSSWRHKGIDTSNTCIMHCILLDRYTTVMWIYNTYR